MYMYILLDKKINSVIIELLTMTCTCNNFSDFKNLFWRNNL